MIVIQMERMIKMSGGKGRKWGYGSYDVDGDDN